MKAPAARATPYFAAVAAAIVLYLIVGTIATRLVLPTATITPAIGGLGGSVARGTYEKTTTNADGITNEKWDSAAREGSYQRMVARRFPVEIHGDAADLGMLKMAAGAIGAGRLAALAKG